MCTGLMRERKHLRFGVRFHVRKGHCFGPYFPRFAPDLPHFTVVFYWNCLLNRPILAKTIRKYPKPFENGPGPTDMPHRPHIMLTYVPQISHISHKNPRIPLKLVTNQAKTLENSLKTTNFSQKPLKNDLIPRKSVRK